MVEARCIIASFVGVGAPRGNPAQFNGERSAFELSRPHRTFDEGDVHAFRSAALFPRIRWGRYTGPGRTRKDVRGMSARGQAWQVGILTRLASKIRKPQETVNGRRAAGKAIRFPTSVDVQPPLRSSL